MKRNYKKQQAIREKGRIKRCDQTNTTKIRLLRNLETAIEYDDAVESSTSTMPIGIFINDKLSPETQLLNDALKEVDAICETISQKIGDNISNKVSNYRFAINTPYFSRNSEDPFPLYHWDDARVKNLRKCVERGLRSFEKAYSTNLNIIIRRYRRGDNIKFHSDRSDFGEQIFGIVLENKDCRRSLVLKAKKHSYSLDEKPGLCWMLTGDSRWEYEHGYCTYFKGKDESIRTSITFRFFQKESSIPKKAFEKIK